MVVPSSAAPIASWYGRQTSATIVRDLLGIIAKRSGECLEIGSGCKPLLVDELSSHFVETVWDAESLKMHPHSQIYKTEYTSLPFADGAISWAVMHGPDVSTSSVCEGLFKELYRVICEDGGLFLLRSYAMPATAEVLKYYEIAIRVAKSIGFHVFATRQAEDITSLQRVYDQPNAKTSVTYYISGIFLAKEVMAQMIREKAQDLLEL